MKATSKIVRSTFSKGVIIPSFIFILLVSVTAAIFPKATESGLNVIQNFIFVNLNWVLVWAVTIFIVFLVYLMFSKYGKIRLGANNSRPEHSFFSWIAMLFAAGMGIGLMYFSVAEPMQHYVSDVFADSGHAERARNAQLYTFFHWGIHAWAIYALVGLALAYFAYRYKLPLSLRSCLYPLLKDKINGRWGNLIDIFAFCSTFFGIVTSLGFGVVQVNSGLESLHILPSTGFKYQILIIAVLVSCSIISAVSGVEKGIKRLSNANIVGVVFLLLFILFMGPTTYLIGAFTEGVGDYISNFFHLTFNTHVYNKEELPWFYDWTILYWAWWISWSPFVGLFIAKISKGRTIREYIAAVLVLPTLFNMIWMSVLGNSAMWFDFNVADGALSKLADNPDALTFEFLKYIPLTPVISGLVVAVIVIFFVTSADSGILVMDSIATKNARNSPKWQKITMGLLLAVLSLVLLNAGGLNALQTMTLITALPFTFIVFMFIVSLTKALMIDNSYFSSDFSVYTVPWSGDSWKDRLKAIASSKGMKTVDNFIKTTVKEAFVDLRSEFNKNKIKVEIKTARDPIQIELRIPYDTVNNFVYGVKTDAQEIPEYIEDEKNLPGIKERKSYIAKSYFGDNRKGYDVHFFNKEELIADVLKHYERYLGIISEEENRMFVSRNANAEKR